MSPSKCSAVLDGQLYTHSRSHWPSAFAFCHSAEFGRTALSIEQLRSSALFCGGLVDLEFAVSLRNPELSLDTFKRQLKTYIFAKYWWHNVLSALEIFLSMRYINLFFTYLLTLSRCVCCSFHTDLMCVHALSTEEQTSALRCRTWPVDVTSSSLPRDDWLTWLSVARSEWTTFSKS